MEKKKQTPEQVFKEYDRGVRFKSEIGLFEDVKKCENFYIGKQWEGVVSNGLPTPTFNFLRRVTLYEVANIASDNLAMESTPLASTSKYQLNDVEQLCDVVNKQFDSLMERNKIVFKGRQFIRNAAVDGDGCLYSYFDPDVETGQDAKGDIKTEVIENTRVFFGNPNDREVQSQPYIIISQRKQLKEVRHRAKKNGCKDWESIRPDGEENASDYDMKQDDKVTVLTKLWKDLDTGHIHSYVCCRDSDVEKEKDTELKLYPICWMNWDYVQDSYHGCGLITQLIPNQIFVNKLMAMVERSMSTLAFSKVIFDKTRLPYWSNGVGQAIAVNGPVADVAKVMDPAPISPQIGQFIQMAVDMTQNFMGASDAALGDTRPDNTSAIIALQRASNAPLELIKQNYFESMEDLGRIYIDMMRVYYGQRYVQVKMLSDQQQMAQPLGMQLPDNLTVNTLYDFSVLNEIPVSMEISVGPSSYWSEIASVQTLDNLIMNNKLELDDYLERLPEGLLSKKQELIDKIRSRMMMQAMPMGGSGAKGPMIDTNQPLPVPGGKGYGALQRALNETGVV